MEKLVFPKNEEKAKQMEDYMRNQFLFAGVPKPERAHMQKKLLLESKYLSVSEIIALADYYYCLLYTSPGPRDAHESRMPSSA